MLPWGGRGGGGGKGKGRKEKFRGEIKGKKRHYVYTTDKSAKFFLYMYLIIKNNNTAGCKKYVEQV